MFEARRVEELAIITNGLAQLLSAIKILTSDFLICTKLEPGVMTATSLVPLSRSLSRPP
jgi:hypothetical protein